MEELILAGRITVNRMPAEIGQKVGPTDEVRINGEPVKIRFAEPPPRVLVYHKPPGEIVTRDDPEARTTVFEDLPPIEGAKWIAIGRLDYNTEGLLLFTNSGELANRLMHPRYEVEREYSVRIMGRLDEAQMEKLVTGVDLDDGVAKCDKVEDGGGEEEGANHWYHVVLKEGRNREVRRLFEALGLTVSRLIRTRYGRVSMPAAIKRGQTLELQPQDVTALMTSVGLRAPGAQGKGQGPRPQQGAGGKPRHGHGQGPRQHGQGQGQGQGQRQGRGQGQGQRQGQPQRHGQGQGQGPEQGQGPGQGYGQGQRHGQGQGQRRGQGQGRGPGQGGGQGRPQGQGARDPNRALPDQSPHATSDDFGNRIAPAPRSDEAGPSGNAGPRRDGNAGARPPGNNKFRGKSPRPPGQGGKGQGGFRQGGNAPGNYGQGGGNSPGNYGQTNYGNGEVVGRQPQLTMHSHGQGNHAPNRPGFGPKQNRNRRGPGQPPKQVWVGLPKDEDEPK
jgi:23S rRNA pseudouridine2605 synthase